MFISFVLCDRVDDAQFEGDQEQVFDENFQQEAEEGKWTSLSAYSILSY